MGESPKVEARLKPLMQTALSLYMQDRHLDNESEVLRSALGKFLETEGYIKRAAAMLGIRVAENAHEVSGAAEKPRKRKRVTYTGSKNRAKARG